MSNKIFFTPGPTQLFYTYQDHFREAIKQDVGSISHRSKEFMRLFQETRENLHQLLELTDDHRIYFTGSANEIWERMVQNLVINRSHHFLNGAFAKKFYDFALQYQKSPSKTESPFGQAYDSLDIPDDAELCGITLNETSNGFMFPAEDIYQIKKENPDCLMAIDGVSALPAIPVDFNYIDTAYFSVQKCFGMPAGLGVWIANKRCIEKSQQMETDGMVTGSYHSLTSFEKYGQKNQTPETPNALSIFILGKIAEDMLRRGVSYVRNESVYKSTILYQTAESISILDPFIKEKKYRSKTVAVCNAQNGSGTIIEVCKKKGWVLGSGYSDQKQNQVRIANFPMHSKEQVEQLCDFLVREFK
ncbi:MAG: aminotransferase class V-fold PLP-dependent enzyme [Cyclobacteriaceae bacterium]